MFETFKVYIHKEIALDDVIDKLIKLKYQRQSEIGEEGDFSVKGDTLELFPANFSFPVRIEWEFTAIKKMYSFDKSLNKKIVDYDFLIVIPYQKKIRRYSEEIPLDAVLRIKKGDYVVHSDYGIGRFLGLKKIKVDNGQNYFFEIEYQNKDKLYVSREDAHLIQRYASFSLRPPKLTRLGSREWSRLKNRVESGIKYFALQLLRMEAYRKFIGGFKYSPDGDWQKEFESLFPYHDTEDQRKAVEEVKRDMEADGCMDRLICGDVGYGKTEVAMRAAFKAVVDSKQVCFLVPTTILAYQHYKNLAARLEKFPLRVEMLSRFKTPSEQKCIVKDLKEGKIDIVVGTHRLFSGDVSFRDLGLLIIDEEQRFGVRHKERIKKIKLGIDLLTLTATPIPRTLYMSLVGIKDISIIKTPPKDRLAVVTKLVEFSPEVISHAVLKEVRRKGQVFFIHNRIETIDKIRKQLSSILPSAIRVGLVHGRLSSKEIEKVMLMFIEKRIDCLLSTAIVESGIDIPAANTIIINHADKFGLSDLHQLRGRVGRLDIQSYAYLLVPRLKVLSRDALKRLRLVEEFSHLGSGFDIAMSDLELRGAGNILGAQQHGFIWMIGFDLYCRLLKKEIEYLKEVFQTIRDKEKN
ncbi:MAG: DEAD/DEAH box helicase [Candidatus Omnitrophota bacterium]